VQNEINLATLPTVFAFCAIGNPSAFFRQLESASVHVGGRKAFRDHHRFTSSDVTALEDEARRSECEALITTAKDAVRLTNLVLTMPCYVAEMEIEIDDIYEFRKLIGSS
jgi:tetraacyldisaccharide 4'-kinase